MCISGIVLSLYPQIGQSVGASFFRYGVWHRGQYATIEAVFAGLIILLIASVSFLDFHQCDVAPMYGVMTFAAERDDVVRCGGTAILIFNYVVSFGIEF